MVRKRWYSDDDIELAKTALSELPDLSTQRKSLPDFLAAIADDIQALVKTKGYSVADIKSTLATAGYDIGEKAIREMLQKNSRGTGAKNKTSPKKTGAA
ncbi:molybdopterin-guanine dinucleotide biosynthesis protein MobC [Klebsiella sp. PL-2018]|uniref:molybdopterin-guanine dinucleotide biosynthesis protein MobC n=1 Tax=Klebsiella TaxID=570 RepID=UPI001C24EBFF|nr:molybdopterin-guanine dinucleotide biosynthesis protein MobC [Klebsiella sp. PL-2018]